MKKHLKSIVLILVTAIIIFVVPVSADMVARPEIINPETDFSLNNPEAEKAVTALSKAENGNGEIIGPFNFYFVHENGNIELRFADYYASRDDGKIILITLMQSYDGYYAGQARIIEKSSDEYITENHITISNESAGYIISASGVKYIKPIPQELRYSTPEKLKAVNNVVKRSAKYLLKASVPQRVYLVSNTIRSSPINDTWVGNEVPCILMGYQTTCYSACIASIVRHRETAYSSVSDSDTLQAGISRFGDDFENSTLVTIEQIYDVLMKDYLDNVGNHYSLSFGINSSAMSQSSYKSIIDNGCVILGVFREPAYLANMHALVLCQYKTENNTTIARGMEPANGELRSYFWSGNRIVCPFGNKTLHHYDHITSYY